MSLVDISGREYSDLTVNAAPSCEDISQMIRLCPDYSLLGGRLLDTATSLANERAAGTTLPGGIRNCLEYNAYSFRDLQRHYYRS